MGLGNWLDFEDQDLLHYSFEGKIDQYLTWLNLKIIKSRLLVLGLGHEIGLGHVRWSREIIWVIFEIHSTIFSRGVVL